VTDASGLRGMVTREDLISADPELETLLFQARCAGCGARQHLRPWPDGKCICQSCKALAADRGLLEAVGGQ
jgi:hypothetical protein